MNEMVVARTLIAFTSILAIGTASASGIEGTFSASADSDGTIERAIENGTASMNFIKRPIARSRLKKTNPPVRLVTIARTGDEARDEIVITFDARKPARSPATGTPVKWTREDGEVFDLSTRLVGDTLTQTFKAEDGSRTNSFALSPDGRELTFVVRLESPQLNAPIEYTLTLTRRE
jgi:hypothetical protein